MALGSYTPEVGGPFIVHQGGFDIQGNRANLTATALGAGAVATVNVRTWEVTVSCILRPVGGLTDAGIIGRYQDADNHWLISLDDSSNTLNIFERTSGVYTRRAQGAATITGGADHALEVLFGSGRIVATLGAVQLEYAPATAHAFQKQFGIRGNTVGDRFDDLLITIPTFTRAKRRRNQRPPSRRNRFSERV